MQLPLLLLAGTLLCIILPTAADMIPAQLIGTYTRLPLPPFSPTCPDGIRVLQVDPITTNEGVFFVISHSNIRLPIQGGSAQTCISVPVTAPRFNNLSATVLQRSTEAFLDMRNPLVNAFNIAGELFFLGQELGPRTCGQAILPDRSVSMWVAPESILTVPAGAYTINFRPGFKYIYYFSVTDPCLYRGNAQEVGTVRPVPTPASPTPSPQPQQSPQQSPQQPPQILAPVPVPSVAPLPSPANVNNGVTGIDPGVTVSDGIVTSTPTPGPACFPYDAIVETKRGTMVIGELKVGDEVIVGKGRYSRVFAFTHATRTVWVDFVKVKTEKRSLALSSGHYIFVNGRATRADQVRKGDLVHDVEDGETKVISVGNVWKKGLYNPQTENGGIVVDGVVVTTYTSAVGKMMTAHALLTPIRWLARSLSVDGALQRIRLWWLSYYRICRL